MSGLVAAFDTEDALEHAVARLRANGITEIETYTPKARSEDEAGRGSPIPLLIFLGGIFGAAGMFGLETYSSVLNWPVDIGGRPAFSWPAFVPIAFEVGILFAINTGFFAYLIVNRMPRLWEPVDETAAMRSAMRDEFVVAVHSTDHAEFARARRLLESLQPLTLEETGRELEEVPA